MTTFLAWLAGLLGVALLKHYPQLLEVAAWALHQGPVVAILLAVVLWRLAVRRLNAPKRRTT
jgi:uncharacterized membrane protein